MTNVERKPRLTEFKCGDQELYRIVRNKDDKVINYVWAHDAKDAWDKALAGGATEVRVVPERWYWRES